MHKFQVSRYSARRDGANEMADEASLRGNARNNISQRDLDKIHQNYNILMELELVPTGLDDSLMTPKSGCLCVNEHMFKADIRLPLEFDITEALIMALVASIQLVSNTWKILRVVTWFTKWSGLRIDHVL
ncbi:hypothetical protein ACLOJK_035620 [Asimina triloba]